MHSEELDLDGDGHFELRRLYAPLENPDGQDALAGARPDVDATADPVYGVRPPLRSVQADYEGDGRWIEVDAP